MRIAFGPVPLSATLREPEVGWTLLRELPPARFSTIASVLGLPLVALAILVLGAARGEVRTLFSDHPAALAGFVATLLALVPVHEAVHAVAYFQDLRSAKMIAGVWPRRGMCYVLYDAPLPRNRVLLMSAAPFLVLTVAPLCAAPWLHGTTQPLVLFLAILHAAICTGDFLVFARIAHQVPRDAWVQNNGWQTYWSRDHQG
jgi:hypothetical protein